MRLSLRTKLPLSIVGLGIASSAAMGWIAYSIAASSLNEEASARLALAASARQQTLNLLADRAVSDLRNLSNEKVVISNVGDFSQSISADPEVLQAILIHFRSVPEGQRIELDGSELPTTYGRRHAEVHGIVQKHLSPETYTDALIVDLSGIVVYSAQKSSYFALQPSELKQKSPALFALIERLSAAKPDEVVFQDFSASPETKSYSAYIGQPIHRRSNVAMDGAQKLETAGYVILEVTAAFLDRVFQDRNGLGATGQTYVIGRDNLLRTSPPLTPNVSAGSSTNGIGRQGVFAASSKAQFLGSDWIVVAEQLQGEALAGSAEITRLIGLAGFVIAIVQLVLGGWLTKSITRPLNMLREQMSSIAKGQLQTIVAGIDRQDEVGAMARAVDVFRTNGLKTIELEAKATKEREDRDAEKERERKARQEEEAAANALRTSELDEQRRREDAERCRQSDIARVTISEIARGLDKLAGGNLDYRISGEFPKAFAQLQTDFNAAAVKLEGVMRRVAETATKINDVVEETASAATDLSHRTERQAASIEETAAALNGVTGTVQANAAGAAMAIKSAEEAKATAEQGQNIVAKAMSAMTKIEGSSTRIANIIGAIDEIAFQTNLLALNAGVEAARAGEAGRGFAVVATEVRSLSMRCAEAAKEIREIIHLATGQIESGAGLVREAGGSLDKIVQGVQKIDKLVRDLASGSTGQAKSLVDVNRAVTEIETATRQNAAMVEESTAANASLAAEVRGLSSLLQQFKTSDRKSSHAGVLDRLNDQFQLSA